MKLNLILKDMYNMFMPTNIHLHGMQINLLYYTNLGWMQLL